MRWKHRRKAFRDLLAGDHCVHPASVFDPISMRIAEDLGFEVGMFAGSVASMTVLGDPDLILLTLTELADQAYRICRAGNLPLLVDADHGYGNALNVKRTVEELENAGVAAMSIEDTDLPQPFGELGGTRLIPIEQGVGKMRAALAGRRDPALVIAGRTSAATVSGVEDAVERISAYERAGVDAIFLVGVKNREHLDELSNAVALPLIIGGSGKELMDHDYLSSRRVRVCLQGHQPFMAAVQAVYEALRALREGAPADGISGVASPDLIKRVTRDREHRDRMRDFLGGR